MDSIEKYLTTSTIEKILQDARLVLESDHQVARNVLAGIILVALGQINSCGIMRNLAKDKSDF